MSVIKQSLQSKGCLATHIQTATGPAVRVFRARSAGSFASTRNLIKFALNEAPARVYVARGYGTEFEARPPAGVTAPHTCFTTSTTERIQPSGTPAFTGVESEKEPPTTTLK
ncbi:hypothetical protein EVAR_48685_1 [Eumeta japonica]|uniref:Uncharacterized protein n=1 Tax=Eumeta variegata TaxID=151549 RepID=A0A4C1X7E4_EUMVA|nr:hypothetical protein EVAR_48685_1 [Eumeta japonica]